MKKEYLIRVIAPHFVAGVIVVDGKVVKIAPILSWAKGKSFFSFRNYCLKKRWKLESLSKDNL